MNSFYEIDANDGLAHLRKAELLNAGIVGIPSNREALITASKALATTVAEDTDVQSAHDTAVAAGAKCAHTETSTETTPETQTAAPAAVVSPAAVDVAQAKAAASAAEAALALL